MARQRFDTAPEFRVADDSVVIQQVAGSSAPLLELKDHTGSALMTINATGVMTSSSPSLTGTPTAPTAAAGTNTTQIATTAFVRTEISNLIDAAPSALDTLNELAAALGDDANFSSTVTTALGLKAPLASPTFTGSVGIGASASYPLHIQTSAYDVAAFQSSGQEVKVSLISTSSGGRTYSIISGGSGGAFSGGMFGIWDNTASTLRLSITSAGVIRLNGGLQMGTRSRQQTQTGGYNATFGSVISDEYGDTNRIAYFCGTNGVSTWYGTASKVFGAIDGNGSEGLSFWSNDSAGTWANIINYGASLITFNRPLDVATWRGRIDRAWDNYPSITVYNSTDLGPQGEFRIHGYPGGSGGDYSINLRIDGSYLNLSDARIKTNITPIVGALDIVSNLNGVRYQRMNRSLQPETHTNINNGVKFGLIAQDSIPFIPECVSQTIDAQPLENGWCDEYAMDYAQLTPLLIEAIKELTARVAQLEAAQ